MINRPSFHKSFIYAYEGIIYTIQTQRMMKIHLSAAIIVLAAALIVRLPLLSSLFILLAITLVLMAEVMNTAIEKAVDLTTAQVHPLAKAAKDCAAGAVLICSVFAILVGVIVFYEPALLILQGQLPSVDKKLDLLTVIFTFILVFLITGIPHIIWGTKAKPITIHVVAALCFAVVTFIPFFTSNVLLAVIGYVLFAALTFAAAWRKSTFRSVLMGLIVGCVVTTLVAVYYT
ncbi:diacylglycerol kinase family protein [Paenibacillus sp. KN14-4R]|uniref:diacylglycerol kinase family protein n=1 Tax=Paenibacillus sp. KN14-4R TaxID=3445773 RepID=UPI003FA12F17